MEVENKEEKELPEKVGALEEKEHGCHVPPPKRLCKGKREEVREGKPLDPYILVWILARGTSCKYLLENGSSFRTYSKS
ncbi:hypothetical protein M0802_005805 [Mischocyttarus mexicanus]|nr:hypothetical protein M0802_005805 [Mischocyttarus mexicanus]